MRDNLEPYVIGDSVSVMDALKKIDDNRKGFLIVLDEDGFVLGTLTDGDLRRAFIKGTWMNDTIDGIFKRDFRSLPINSDISDVTELFKNESIKFLPIIDENGQLCNIITKNQMNAVLLQDIHADLTYDFMSLDEGIIDYEINQGPWGFYKTMIMNDYFQSKIISVRPGEQLSLQSHKHREEYWIVAHGTGTVQLDDEVSEVHCGSTVFIPKGFKHRLTNTDEKESLIVTEVQIGDYFGEDDIIRYEDDYGRA